jgi:hypothetical protein
VTGVLSVGEAKGADPHATLASAADASVDCRLSTRRRAPAPGHRRCGSDLVVLVTEPTPFGLHDLRLAVEMVHALGLRCVVAVNRADLGDDRVHRFCADQGIEIVLEVANDRRIA